MLRARSRPTPRVPSRIALLIALAIAAAWTAACEDRERAAAGASKSAGEAAAPGRGEAPGEAPLRDGWTPAQRALLESLAIGAPLLPPADPSNRVADDPEAAALGHRLFFDPRLSSNGRVACASCHDPARGFTDGLAVSRGVGVTNRNAPTLVGAAWSRWQFWDGRRDSLWAQALAPLESAAEMNLTRVEVVRRVASDPVMEALYRTVFGRPPLGPGIAALPERAGPFGDPPARAAWARLPAADRAAIDEAFANVGKALAAYQRLLAPGPGRFDRYVQALSRDPGPSPETLDPIAREGLRLFIDPERTACLRCHNGPLFTNQGFHRVGTDRTAEGLPEYGRFLGVQAVLLDPFNCLGAFSDAEPDACRELRFLRRDHVDAELGRFKTPTLRGLRKTAPYMHDGRFATLAAVIDHYRTPPPGGPEVPGGHELLPLALGPAEGEALIAFLESLDGETRAEARWLAPPAPPDDPRAPRPSR